MTEAMLIAAGPRKRLLVSDYARRWRPGDVVRNFASGENLLVRRVDDRGALVKRAIGTVRAQPIRESDRLVTVATVIPWMTSDDRNLPVNQPMLVSLVEQPDGVSVL